MNERVQFDNVSKSFRHKGNQIIAVRDLSFSIFSGEAIGFVGQNGAGKSTSMKMLMGMLKPDKGEIRLMEQAAQSEKARKNVGYVPENPYLYDYLTPLEIVVMGLEIHERAKGDSAAKCAMKWLERVGVAYAAHKRVRNLSKGMTQRTALAHALAIEPKLLVLDEPMSGLDPVGRKLVADEIQAYRGRGGTVFFSSHVLNDVERLASRLLLIHKGELRADKSMAEVLSQGDLVLRYKGTGMDGYLEDGMGLWKKQIKQSELQATLQTLPDSVELVDVQRSFNLEQLFVDIVKE
ncbi:MAG: ABC transporter ATP-binding protein [Brachymonas sp.]|nr:ABC transporter ATP-binding protein [Brachymonas sp.]